MATPGLTSRYHRLTFGLFPGKPPGYPGLKLINDWKKILFSVIFTWGGFTDLLVIKGLRFELPISTFVFLISLWIFDNVHFGLLLNIDSSISKSNSCGVSSMFPMFESKKKESNYCTSANEGCCFYSKKYFFIPPHWPILQDAVYFYLTKLNKFQ